MENELKRYKVLLEPGTEPEEWNENGLYGFLGNRLGSEEGAADAIAEADEKRHSHAHDYLRIGEYRENCDFAKREPDAKGRLGIIPSAVFTLQCSDCGGPLRFMKKCARLRHKGVPHEQTNFLPDAIPVDSGDWYDPCLVPIDIR